jgi:hypothetical protein
MPPPSFARPPGWYRDPDDPTSLRHWGGYEWSDRRRIRPGWDLPDSDWIAPPLPSDTGGPVLEGPAHSASLPAIAAAASGRTHTRTVGNGGRQIPRTADLTARSRRPLPPRLVIRQPSWNARRPVLAIVGIAMAGLLTLVAVVALTRPLHPLPWSLDDPQVLIDANAVCAKTLTGARPPTAAAMTSGIPAPSAPALTQWGTAVQQAGDRITQLPSLPDNVAAVNTWLSQWHAYSLDEINYASWLRANSGHPSSTQSKIGSSLADAARSNANRADTFVDDNGLSQCVLDLVPSNNTPTT